MPADVSIYTGMRPSATFGGNFNELDQLSFLRQNPTLERDAAAAGWRPDGRGNYTRQYNGMDQTVPAAMLVGMLEEQKQATALSQPVPVGSNYLSQIQSLLGQTPAADPAAYDNPYERRLLEIMDNPDQIANTNAYKFRFNQGQQALERSAAARGMLNSGNTLAALADYGQGQASQEYGNEFNRLSQAVGQRNQFNLSKAGLTSQDRNSQAGVALRALGDYDQTRIAAQKAAAENARNLGRINPGDRSRTATW